MNFYESENPSDGKFCIYWNGSQRYGAISFDFMPNKDLSVLKNEGYVFSCMIKGNIPSHHSIFASLILKQAQTIIRGVWGLR
ncbi:MAG: hypothetical protein MZV64_12390 [Ignavibacteriales bacterium]|nr:hypothetical protein [Ignavibacteriales bacterium]